MRFNNIGRTLLLSAALLVSGAAERGRSAEGHPTAPKTRGGGPVASRSIQTPEPHVVRVTAERFSFTPSRIVVNPGETIEFRLTSDDTAHGFRINGTDVNVVVPKRGMPETTVTLTAPAPGKYAIECTRMCGAGHNFMRGELVVREQARGTQR
jgi:cytochrome c oxidase subunit II